MAKSFNLTAELNLRGPANIRPVINNIRRQLGSITADVRVNIDRNTQRNIDGTNAALQRLNTTLSQISANSTRASANIQSLTAQISSLRDALDGADRSLASSANSARNTADTIERAGRQVRQSATEMEEFGRQAGLAVRRFAAFSLSTGAIFTLTNAISKAISEFIDFDRQLVRLTQITGESYKSISRITAEVTNLSTSLGVSSSSLIGVADTLAQAGLSARDTEKALKALALSAIAPSFDDLNSTVEGSIALMRQFNISAGDLEQSLGSINAVAAGFAVEAGDIIKAISRTGGVFASASKGISEGKDALNEFIAVFTSVRATTRESAETIATGLRTIFTRIQRESTITALKEYGVELQDLEGKFVGPYEAVKRLSEGLSDLDNRDIRFTRIVEELGGFRQIGKVLPLIQQFSVAQQALGVAQKGSSSLTIDAIKAQQSLAVQFTKTRESFVALIRDIGQSDSFQGVVKTFLQLSNVLIKVADVAKPLLPIITAMAAVQGTRALVNFGGGFLRGARPGGDAREGPDTTGGPTPTRPRGGGGAGPSEGGTSRRSEALANSINSSINSMDALTSSINPLTQINNNLNTSLTTLNANISRLIASMSSGSIPGFARGGVVPGTGNRDTVPAMLQPGEFVIRKKAVETIGTKNLHKINRYAGGGNIKAGLSKIENIRVDDGDTFQATVTPNADSFDASFRLWGYDAYETGNKQSRITRDRYENIKGYNKRKSLRDFPTQDLAEFDGDNIKISSNANVDRGGFTAKNAADAATKQLEEKLGNYTNEQLASVANQTLGADGGFGRYRLNLGKIIDDKFTTGRYESKNSGGFIQRFLDGGWVKRMQAQKKSVLTKDLKSVQTAALFAGDTGAYIPSYDGSGKKEMVNPKELIERMQALQSFLGVASSPIPEDDFDVMLGDEAVPPLTKAQQKKIASKQSRSKLKSAGGYNPQELLDAVTLYQGGSGPIARAMLNKDFIFIDRKEEYDTEDVVGRLQAASQYKAPKKLYSGLGRGQIKSIFEQTGLSAGEVLDKPASSLKKLVGSTVSFPTFLSTSTDSNIAEAFVGSPGAMFTIDSSKTKQKGIDVLKAKQTTAGEATLANSRRLPGLDKINPIKLMNYDQEKEFVLPPQANFKIRSVKQIMGNVDEDKEYYASMFNDTKGKQTQKPKTPASAAQQADSIDNLKGTKLDIKAQMLRSGGMAQRLVEGGGIEKGQQFGGVGIFDSDMIGAGSKDVLNSLLASGKPYDVISGPAGAGKTTFATQRFGNNFVLSAEDLANYAEFVVLSGAGATKDGGFSPATLSLMAGARKIISLQPPEDTVLQRRQGRLDQATAGALPDKRSVKQLEGTLKAPTAIDRQLYKGLSNVEFVQNFVNAGAVERDLSTLKAYGAIGDLARKKLDEDENLNVQQALITATVEQLKALGGEAGVKKLTKVPANLTRKLRTDLIQQGKISLSDAAPVINNALAEKGTIDAAEETRIAKLTKVGIAGLLPIGYSNNLEWTLDSGNVVYANIRGLSKRYAEAIAIMQQKTSMAANEFAENLQYTDIFGGGEPLAFDFDETLVSGTDILNKEGKPDIFKYADRDIVAQHLAKGRPTRLLTKLKSLIGADPEFIKKTRILTARPQSTADLLAQSLQSFGLPYQASDVTGVSEAVASGAFPSVADAKARNLTQLEKLIDDNLDNIQAAQKSGKKGFLYTEPKPIPGLDEIMGQGNIEGAVIEKALAELGANLPPIDQLESNRAVDFPQGLGRSAQFFGLDPDVPTEVKRTLDASSFKRARKEFARFFSPDQFKDGGGVEKKTKEYGKIGTRMNGSEIMATYLPNSNRTGSVHAKSLGNDLYTVGLSKATGGYGPRLYDVVMEIATAHGSMLTSDRNSVSNDAKGVWDYYFRNRSDVKKQPLDPSKWTKNSSLIDPKLYGREETWPPPTDPAWVLQSGYTKKPSIIHDENSVINLNDPKYNDYVNQQKLAYLSRNRGGTITKFAGGGSAQDTVPALLTPGEFVINKKAAARIGSAQLNKLNKADKIQGYNRGGIVGGVQMLADGGFGKDTATKLGYADFKTMEQALVSAYERAQLKAYRDARKGGATATDAKKQADTIATKRLESLVEKAISRLNPKGTSTPRAERDTDAIKEVKAIIESVLEQKAFSSGKRDTAAESPEAKAKRKKEALNLKVLDKTMTGLDNFSRNILSYGAIVAGATSVMAELVGKTTAAGAVINSFAESVSTVTATTWGTIQSGMDIFKSLPKTLQKSLGSRLGSFAQTKAGAVTGGVVGGAAIGAAGAYTVIKAMQAYDQALREQKKKLEQNNLDSSLQKLNKSLEDAAKSTEDSAYFIQRANQELNKAIGSALALADLDKTNPNRGMVSYVGENIGAVAGSVAGGAIGGAALGASIGTVVFPGVGTAIGGAIGTLAGGILGVVIDQFMSLSGRSTDENIAQRSEIANRMGTGAYFDALFSSQSQRQYSQNIAGAQAQETAAQLQPVRQAQIQVLEQRMRKGENVSDITNAPDWESQRDLIARSNAQIEEQLRIVDADLTVSKEEREAKKDAIKEEYARIEVMRQANDVQNRLEKERLEAQSTSYLYSLERSYGNMEQAVNSTSYSLSKMQSALEASSNALLGQARIMDTSIDAISTIQNPNVSTAAQRDSAYGLIQDLMGSAGRENVSLLEYGANIEGTILSSINKSLGQAGQKSDSEIEVDVNKNIASAIEDLDIGDALKRRLADQTAAAVSEIRKKGDVALNFDDLADKVPGLRKVVDATQRAQEVAIKRLEFYQQALNNYAEATNKVADLQYSAGEKLRRAADIRIKSEEELTRALGKRVSFESQQSSARANVRSLAGTTDPSAIFGNMIKLENQRSMEQAKAQRAAQKGSTDEFQKMTNQVNVTNLQMRKNYEALKELADSSEVASAALSKIQEAREKQAARENVLERYVTSTPEEQNNMSAAFERLQNNMDGLTNNMWQSTRVQKAYQDALKNGATFQEAQRAADSAAAEDRRGTLDAFNMIAPLLGDQQNELKANVLESMMRESGVQASPIFLKALEGLRNPQADPEVEAALSEYRKANELQATANEYLAMLDGKVASQIAQESDSLLRKSLTDVTQKFEFAQDNDLTQKINSIDTRLKDGIKVFPDTNISGDSNAQELARGGIVYASIGGSMFKPKGTDTVPAMLTPGEFVVNRQSAQKHMGTLQAINSGNYARGGKVSYYAAGGPVTSTHLKDLEERQEYKDILDADPNAQFTSKHFSMLGPHKDVERNITDRKNDTKKYIAEAMGAFPLYDSNTGAEDVWWSGQSEANVDYLKNKQNSIHEGGLYPSVYVTNPLNSLIGAGVDITPRHPPERNFELPDMSSEIWTNTKYRPDKRNILLTLEQAQTQRELLPGLIDSVVENFKAAKDAAYDPKKDRKLLDKAGREVKFLITPMGNLTYQLGAYLDGKYTNFTTQGKNVTSAPVNQIVAPDYEGVLGAGSGTRANSNYVGKIRGEIFQQDPAPMATLRKFEEDSAILEFEKYLTALETIQGKEGIDSPIQQRMSARANAINALYNNRLAKLVLKKEDLSNEFINQLGDKYKNNDVTIYSRPYRGRWSSLLEQYKSGIEAGKLNLWNNTDNNAFKLTGSTRTPAGNFVNKDQYYPWSWGAFATSDDIDAAVKQELQQASKGKFSVTPRQYSRVFTDPNSDFSAKIGFMYDQIQSRLWDSDLQDYAGNKYSALVPWYEDQQTLDPMNINPFYGIEATQNGAYGGYQNMSEMEKAIEDWVQKSIYGRNSILETPKPIDFNYGLYKDLTADPMADFNYNKEVDAGPNNMDLETGNSYANANDLIGFDQNQELFKKYAHIHSALQEKLSANNAAAVNQAILAFAEAASLIEPFEKLKSLQAGQVKAPAWDIGTAHLVADPVWQRVKDIAPNLGENGTRNAAEWKATFANNGGKAVPDSIKSMSDIDTVQSYLSFVDTNTKRRNFETKNNKNENDKISNANNLDALGKIVSAWGFIEESSTQGYKLSNKQALGKEERVNKQPFSQKLASAYSSNLDRYTIEQEVQAGGGANPWNRSGDNKVGSIKTRIWDSQALAVAPGFVDIILAEQAKKIESKRLQNVLSFRDGFRQAGLIDQESQMLDSITDNLEAKGMQNVAVSGGKITVKKFPNNIEQVKKDFLNQQDVYQSDYRYGLYKILQDRLQSNVGRNEDGWDAWQAYLAQYKQDFENIGKYLTTRDHLSLNAISSDALELGSSRAGTVLGDLLTDIRNRISTYANDQGFNANIGMLTGNARDIKKLLYLYDSQPMPEEALITDILDGAQVDWSAIGQPLLDKMAEFRLLALREFGPDEGRSPTVYTAQGQKEFFEMIQNNYRAANEAFQKYSDDARLQSPEEIWDYKKLLTVPKIGAQNELGQNTLYASFYKASVGAGKNISRLTPEELDRVKTLPQLAAGDAQKPVAKSTGGIIPAKNLSEGAMVNWAPQGTDTVPAMLTPGEFVVNRNAAQKNLPLLRQINSGYMADGGQATNIKDVTGFVASSLGNTISRRGNPLTLRNVGMGLGGDTGAAIGEFSEIAIEGSAQGLRANSASAGLRGGAAAYGAVVVGDLAGEMVSAAVDFESASKRWEQANRTQSGQGYFSNVIQNLTRPGQAIMQMGAEIGGLVSDLTKNRQDSLKLAPNKSPGRRARRRADGGLIYAQDGAYINFQPRGTDTVPAMLTPGEFVINRDSTQKYLPILEAINQGYTSASGINAYMNKGGQITPNYLRFGGRNSGMQTNRTSGGVLNSYMTLEPKSLEAIRQFTSNFKKLAEQISAISSVTLDKGSLDAINQFSTKFGEFSQSLLKLNIPPVISINATHEVNVNINGASVFTNMESYVGDIVKSEINNAFGRLAQVSENSINLYG